MAIEGPTRFPFTTLDLSEADLLCCGDRLSSPSSRKPRHLRGHIGLVCSWATAGGSQEDLTSTAMAFVLGGFHGQWDGPRAKAYVYYSWVYAS